MSTRIGTLQPKARVGQLFWPAVLVALLAFATIATIAVMIDRDSAKESSPIVREVVPEERRGNFHVGAVKGGYAPRMGVTTPSELGAGLATEASVGGTLANTPSELRGVAYWAAFPRATAIASGSVITGTGPGLVQVAQEAARTAALSLTYSGSSVTGTGPGLIHVAQGPAFEEVNANTPSELRGGMLDEPHETVDQVCPYCWKLK